MKTKLSLLATCLLLLGCGSEALDTKFEQVAAQVEAADTSPKAETVKNGFNAELAKKLGADAYGMRSYVFATLLTGPNDGTITDEAERARLFKGHFDNMGRLAEDGKLVLAGPFVEAPPKRGLFILNVETIAEAEALVQTDPSIAAGIFKVEFAKYYGSAALMQVNQVHKTIQEKDM